MSFSSGTLFGETAAMIMIPSLINLRCATYCEIHTLDLRSLCSVMSQYKQAAKMLHGKLAQRIADAKMMQNPVLLKMKDKQQKRTSIRWLKTQWRSIYRQSKKRNVDAREISTTPCHMSNYLNMYALSGDVELKERVICLKSTCPYVLEPTSSFSKFVEYVIVLVVVKQVMMLPYDIFFNANMSNKNAGLFYMLDLIYVFGLYFQMSTAVKTKELLLTEPKDIIMFKSKQLSVILDVIAVFPFEFVGYAVGSSDYTCMLMHLNRTLKLHKVYTFERAAEKSLLSKAVRLRFFKFTLIFAYLVYFFGCMLYGVACPNKKCFKYSWFAYHQNVTEQLFNNTDRSERGTDFMTSIDYAISLMLGLTDSAIYSYTTTDIILGMFTTFIGYYIFSFCFSELAACTVIYLQENNDFQEFLKTLKVFSSNPNLPLSLKRNMYEMTICEWYYSERHAITGETGILNDAPDNLKKSILYQRIVDCLLTVPVFQECERSILWKLAPLALLNVVPPGTLISREGTFQKYVKVILRGYCRVESSIPTDSYRGNYGIYSTGKVFPLIESFLDINSFIKVVSITFAEIACIPFQSVVCQFKNNDPDFYTDLKISLEQFLQQYDTILMRRKGRLPEMVSSQKSRGKGDFFTYDTNEKFDDEKCRTVIEIGKWTFVQRFFLKSTLSPKKFVYVVWECFRCSVSFVNIVYTMTILKYAMAIHVDTYIQIFFVLITCIDFYIRLHCQYYNRNGIVVTHPWYTAKNYISGAFLMDLFANAPITFLGIESMLHGRLKDTITVALLILTRPFQIYRVYCGIEYARSLNKEEKGILLGRIKYLVMVCVIFLTMAAILEHYTCGYERGTSVVYSCTSNSWIKQSMFGRNVSHFDMVVITNYRVLSLFTTCGLGIFPMKRYYEVIIYLVYIFVLFTLKWVLLAKIISAAIKGNTKLTQYQHDVNVMVKYLQKYLVSKTLTKEAVEHYENLFNRSHGYNVNDFVASFFYVLYTDFAYFMYWPTLKTAELFSGCKSADIRYLCTHFKQCSYKRDARIIRCNDVQELCYIVYKGKVKISIAGTKLKILSPGGSFGCFHVGKTRQTISAIAMVHVELLCVESRLLYIISQKFPQLREKLKKAQYLNTEYMASTHMGRSVASVLVHSESVYMKRWQRFLINPGARWFLAYNYILSVHISTITSMLVIAVVARMDIEKSYYLYIVDVVFLTRLLIGFHLSYVDHETGILVRDFKSIAKKYLTEWTGFCFDLFTSFPLELIATTITNNKIVYFCCWCNRSVRFLHLIFYYNHCKNKLTASKTLKWTFFMYLIAIVIHFMATIWWLGACPNDVCYYVDEVRRDSSVPTASKQFFLNFRISYLYVISIFSSTGVAHQIPRTILELAISIAIIIVSQIMIYTLTSGFANILRLGKYVLNNYEHEMKHLDVFITNANVSIPLINKVREYFVILWLHYSGVSMPSLIAQAPGYLKQDIMYALYGYHITNHVLFSKTHIDFIRQLLVHMDPQVYLPGQYVIEKGDIDGRMYFLHDGEVKVFDKQDNNEIEQCVLSKGASFGEYQAMKHIEHACSVKTTVICVVITLRTLDWNYLLDWFPASREILESRLSTMSPTHIVTKN